MIQRIQSIYLLAAVICYVLMFFLLFPEITAYINAMIIALTLVALMTFKNRPLQIKICKFVLLLTIVNAGFETARISGIALFIHIYVLCLLLIIFAIRAIRKDENLIKAAGRLR